MPKSENQCIILSFVLRIMPQTCSSCAGEILSLSHCACRLCCFGRVRFYVTLWTVAWQAPLSMGFCRQENWSGWPCPPPSDLPHPGIRPISPASPRLHAGSIPTESPGKPRPWQKLPILLWIKWKMKGGF